MPRQRVPRTRAGGSWTEAKYWGHIRSLLRQGFMYYPAKTAVKKAAGRRNGRSVEYQCAACEGWFASKEVQVDHIEPCGSLRSYDDLPGYVERLYCEPEGLQVLCKGCHAKKTKVDNKNTREKRKKKDASS